MRPHVAILIPSAEQRGLANLARDAIAKFTTDVSHEVWLLDTAPDLAHGSEANGRALDRMIRAAESWVKHRPPRVSHVFCMHDDALPLRPGWLSYLLGKPDQVGGVKASERNGFPHASGVLFDIDFALTHSMMPDLPKRDTAEWAGWCAHSHCHRQLCITCQPCWWAAFDCDVSLWKAVAPGSPWEDFYAHFGGGSLNNRPDTAAWIAAAREALDL